MNTLAFVTVGGLVATFRPLGRKITIDASVGSYILQKHLIKHLPTELANNKPLPFIIIRKTCVHGGRESLCFRASIIYLG